MEELEQYSLKMLIELSPTKKESRFLITSRSKKQQMFPLNKTLQAITKLIIIIMSIMEFTLLSSNHQHHLKKSAFAFAFSHSELVGNVAEDELSKTMDRGGDEELHLSPSLLVSHSPHHVSQHLSDLPNLTTTSPSLSRVNETRTNETVTKSSKELADSSTHHHELDKINQFISVINNQSNIVVNDQTESKNNNKTERRFRWNLFNSNDEQQSGVANSSTPTNIVLSGNVTSNNPAEFIGESTEQEFRDKIESLRGRQRTVSSIKDNQLFSDTKMLVNRATDLPAITKSSSNKSKKKMTLEAGNKSSNLSAQVKTTHRKLSPHLKELQGTFGTEQGKNYLKQSFPVYLSIDESDKQSSLRKSFPIKLSSAGNRREHLPADKNFSHLSKFTLPQVISSRAFNSFSQPTSMSTDQITSYLDAAYSPTPDHTAFKFLSNRSPTLILNNSPRPRDLVKFSKLYSPSPMVEFLSTSSSQTSNEFETTLNGEPSNQRQEQSIVQADDQPSPETQQQHPTSRTSAQQLTQKDFQVRGGGSSTSSDDKESQDNLYSSPASTINLEDSSESSSSEATGESDSATDSPSGSSGNRGGDYSNNTSEPPQEPPVASNQISGEVGESNKNQVEQQQQQQQQQLVPAEKEQQLPPEAERELLVGPFKSESEAPATITLSGVVYQKSGSSSSIIKTHSPATIRNQMTRPTTMRHQHAPLRLESNPEAALELSLHGLHGLNQKELMYADQQQSNQAQLEDSPSSSNRLTHHNGLEIEAPNSELLTSYWPISEQKQHPASSSAASSSPSPSSSQTNLRELLLNSLKSQASEASTLDFTGQYLAHQLQAMKEHSPVKELSSSSQTLTPAQLHAAFSSNLANEISGSSSTNDHNPFEQISLEGSSFGQLNEEQLEALDFESQSKKLALEAALKDSLSKSLSPKKHKQQLHSASSSNQGNSRSPSKMKNRVPASIEQFYHLSSSSSPAHSGNSAVQHQPQQQQQQVSEVAHYHHHNQALNQAASMSHVSHESHGKKGGPIVIVQKDVKPVKYHLLRAYLKLRRLLRPFEATYVFPPDPYAGIPLLEGRSQQQSLFYHQQDHQTPNSLAHHTQFPSIPQLSKQLPRSHDKDLFHLRSLMKRN